MFLLVLLIIFKNTVWSQKKVLVTKSTTENITIDGKFNEKAWINADVATDFVMFEPDNGKPISADMKTEIKIIYDNNAVYIAASMYDNEPTKIQREITNRDVFGVSTIFLFLLMDLMMGNKISDFLLVLLEFRWIV